VRVSEPESPSKLEPADVYAVIDDPLVLDERDDADTIVASLPSASFVRVARRLQDEARLDLLLPRATPDQLVCLLDLDAWHGDRLDVARARRWLVAIGDSWAAVDKPRGALSELVYLMDPEFWTLALCAGTRVFVLEPEDEDARDRGFAELSELRVWQTPDSFFLIGVPDDELGLSVLQAISRVYEDDLGQGRKLVLSIHSALPSEIEETLLRFRAGRLADLGFVQWEDAVKLFRPLDHRAAAEASPRDFHWLGGDELGAAMTSFRGNELLRRAMARLSDVEHGVRSREFLLLVNEVIAAQRLPPGDEAVQERALDQTQATLGLGLELLLGTRPAHPEPDTFLADRIVAIGLRDIFRVGYGALDKLRRAAVSLHRTMRVSLASVGSLLDRPWGPAISALVRWYPELPLDSTTSGIRPIRSLADVARATSRIAEAGALASLTFAPGGYHVDPVWIGRLDEPEKVVLGDLVRTAIVHRMLPGSRSELAPLAADDLLWARDHLLEAGKLVEAVTRDLSARCDALGIGRYTTALSDALLTRLRVELLGIEQPDGTVDLTRVGGLITIQSVSMWLTVEGRN
jgi:Family of unknown function (DUF6178)